MVKNKVNELLAKCLSNKNEILKIYNILFAISGLAKNPIEKIKSNGIIKNNRPDFKDKYSPKPPTIKGMIAPPAIPVQRIPEREPWCVLIEFSANENIIEYMTETKKPIKGKKTKDRFALP